MTLAAPMTPSSKDLADPHAAAERRPPLLVGFDDSQPGFDALELARVAAAELGGRVQAARIVEIDDSWLGAEHDDAELVEIEQETRRKVGRRLDGVDHDVTVRLGSAGEALTEMAEEGHAAALIVGSSHRGGVGRALLGSVAEALLQGAPCPVAVAPPEYRRRKGNTLGNRITVGYDGRPESRAAAHAAAEIARVSGAKLEIVAVVQPRPAGLRGASAQPVRRNIELKVEEIARELGARASVEARWEQGDPARALVEASRTADLLVVGSRGYGPIRRALLGSVSRQLIHAADAPILVWPGGER